MERSTEPILPMTLGNMRQNGVRRLIAYCHANGCHHEAIIHVEGWPDEIPVPSIGPRLRLPEVRQPKCGGTAELEGARVMWWLMYHQAADIQVVIVKAQSMMEGRMIVSLAELDEGMTFQEGHQLDQLSAERMPEDCIAKALSRRQAEAVLTKLARA
jgi:hypothetical protein